MENNSYTKLAQMTTVLVFIVGLFFIVLIVNKIKESRFIGSAETLATITVSGEGEVFAVPDTATFTFSVHEEKDTVALAQSAMAEKVDAILSYLEEQGIAEKDIRTVGFSVYPRYEYQQERIVCITAPCIQPPGRQVLAGFDARQTISVKVRDTEEAGTLLSGVGESGATDISGLSFEVDDEDALQAEARALAIEDAKDKAKKLARGLDVRLVRIISFGDGLNYPYYSKSFALADEAYGVGGGSAVDVSIPVGENQIISNVTITYEIR